MESLDEGREPSADDDAVPFASVSSVAILRRSVPRSVLAPHAGCPRGDPAVLGTSLSAFIYFLTQKDRRSETKDLRSEIDFARVAEQQKHLTVNQAS